MAISILMFVPLGCWEIIYRSSRLDIWENIFLPSRTVKRLLKTLLDKLISFAAFRNVLCHINLISSVGGPEPKSFETTDINPFQVTGVFQYPDFPIFSGGIKRDQWHEIGWPGWLVVQIKKYLHEWWNDGTSASMLKKKNFCVLKTNRLIFVKCFSWKMYFSYNCSVKYWIHLPWMSNSKII